MIRQHAELHASLSQQVDVDTRMIVKIGEIVQLYREAGKATARRRMVTRKMLTAIKHEDEKKLRLLVDDWREATKKLTKYKL